MQTVAAHVHHVIDRNAGEQPMPFDHHRPSLVASVSQTRSVSGAITSGGAAVNIRLTDWTEHRSRPNQPRRTTLHREPSPPAPGDGFFAVRDMRWSARSTLSYAFALALIRDRSLTGTSMW